MFDRESLTLIVPLLLAAAVGAGVAMMPSGHAPRPCDLPAIGATDSDAMRCDGKGVDVGARAWLVGHRLDVNRASAADLRRLPKIGRKAAAAIVADRALNGAFETVEALTRVKGLGPKSLERIRPLIVVNASGAG